MKQYLIVLNDSNESLFKLIDSNIWSWMMIGKGDENSQLLNANENTELTDEELENMHFGTVNDRANMALGQIFTSEKELQEYIAKNSVEIAEKYQGILE
jgi:hypothetical protein